MSSNKSKRKMEADVVVVKHIPDLSNDPYVKEKNKMAKDFLEKYPLPDSFKKNRK